MIGAGMLILLGLVYWLWRKLEVDLIGLILNIVLADCSGFKNVEDGINKLTVNADYGKKDWLNASLFCFSVTSDMVQTYSRAD